MGERGERRKRGLGITAGKGEVDGREEKKIQVLKQTQEELKQKRTKEIMVLKKEQDHLVIKKEHLWDNQVKL